MASPRPSFVVYKDEDGTVKLAHTMDHLEPNNSHTTICHRHRINEDKVLKVEIWASDLASSTTKAPWRIDKLPGYAASIEDVESEIIDFTEEAVLTFLTPAVIHRYISFMPDVLNGDSGTTLIKALFTDEYAKRFASGYPYAQLTTGSAMHGYTADTVRAAMGAHLATKTTGLATGAPPQTTGPRMAPAFFLEDLRNPHVWTDLPPAKNASEDAA